MSIKTTPDADQFLTLAQLVKYSGMSRRTLSRRITAPADTALPCYRLPGKILVKRSDFDSWISRFRSVGDEAVTEAVTKLLTEMGLRA